MRSILSTVLELLGVIGVGVGAYLFDWRAAVIVVAALLVFVGYAIDAPDKPGPDR